MTQGAAVVQAAFAACAREEWWRQVTLYNSCTDAGSSANGANAGAYTPFAPYRRRYNGATCSCYYGHSGRCLENYRRHLRRVQHLRNEHLVVAARANTGAEMVSTASACRLPYSSYLASFQLEVRASFFSTSLLHHCTIWPCYD